MRGKENRIYIRVELEKSVKRTFCCTVLVLYCRCTSVVVPCVLHIYVLYNHLGLVTSFYRKSKIDIKRKPNYKIGCFHN